MDSLVSPCSCSRKTSEAQWVLFWRQQSQARGGGGVGVGEGKGWEDSGGQGRACFFPSTGRRKERPGRGQLLIPSLVSELKKAKKLVLQACPPGRAGICFLEPSRKGLISK